MRTRVLVVTLLALGLTGTATAAGASMGPYHVRGTRRCLARHAARFVAPARPPFPEVVGVLEWRAGSPGDVLVVFAATPRRAAALRRRLAHVAKSSGAPSAEVRQGILRLGNVVVYPNSFKLDVPKAVSEVRGCLR